MRCKEAINTGPFPTATPAHPASPFPKGCLVPLVCPCAMGDTNFVISFSWCRLEVEAREDKNSTCVQMIKLNPLELLFSHQPALSSSMFAITAVSGCVIIPVCGK